MKSAWRNGMAAAFAVGLAGAQVAWGQLGPGVGGYHGPVSSAQPAGSLGAGISRGPGAGMSAGALGFNAPARPTFELPRDPHPTFEVPAFNDVQRYHMHGLGYGQQYRHHYGYETGYGAGFYPGFAGYDPGFAGYMDGTETTGDMGTADEAAQPGDGGQSSPGSGYAGDGDEQGGREAYGPQGYGGQQVYEGSPGYGNAGQPSGGAASPRMGVPPYGMPLGPSRRAPYRGSEQGDEWVNTAPVTDGLPHPKVTLIFKDGRAPLEVKSYVLTGAKIIAIDGERELQIPLSELDLGATEKKNQQNGIDFRVPEKQP
jgi:hypothetical protein